MMPGTIAATSNKVSIATSSSSGYSLLLSTKNNFNSLNHTNNTISDKINSVTGSINAPTALLDNTWGLAPLKKGDKVTKEERFDFVEDESLQVMADLVNLQPKP